MNYDLNKRLCELLGIPCENGHVFTWYSSTTIETHAPKGTPCQCGAYEADGEGGVIERQIGQEV